jgi:cell division protein FtsI (penicillin-binding protein 3)
MKRRTNHSNIMFRYGLISLCILAFAFAISAKLFSTTIINAEKWNSKANKELQRTDTITPQRGEILADDGSVLVTNLCYYTLRIDFRSEAFKETEFLNSVDALCDSLAAHFTQRDKDGWKQHLMSQMNKKKADRSTSFRLIENITHPQLELIKSFPFFNIGNPNKTGLIEEPHMKRDRPYGEMARRSIGTVGQTAECSQIHGISGLEKALDSLLYGTPGIYKRVPFTKRIGNWTDIPAINGYNVRTTIDITLQDILENELMSRLDTCGAEWGTAVLMEVATGDIKAISNFQYDPASDRYIEAYNRAIVAYEPGSVIKPISMMLALEDGLVSNLDEVIPIGASFAYGGGKPITDSHVNSSLTVAGVIEQSSNIGMAKIIIRGDNDNPAGFVKRLESIGFFEKMNSGIADEERPRMSHNPTRLDMSRMSYGYTTAIPPLYTLSVYNAIANGGRYVRPRLVSGLQRDGVDSVIPVSYIRDRICSEENAAKMVTMLRRVTEGEHGTGRRLKNPYVSIAGKTGTCYNLNLSTGHYETGKKRLAFCGFFPADAPKYSCMVLIYHPTRNFFGAASTSGEVLKNVALKMYSRGMLGDSSDYLSERVSDPGYPLITATHAGSKVAQIDAVIGNKSGARQLSAPKKKLANGVPDVTSLSLREAIVELEKAGYNVRFKGNGRVVSQTLGTDQTVHLILSNR